MSGSLSNTQQFVETIRHEIDSIVAQMPDPPSPEWYSKYLQMLEQKRTLYEKEQKFKSAELVQQLFEDLQQRQTLAQSFQERRLRDEQRDSELVECESELQDVARHWANELNDFKQRMAAFARELQERQENELQILLRQYEMSELEKTIKYSKTVLNMKKVMDTLAKQKQYREAAEMKAKHDVLGRIEREQFFDRMESKRQNDLRKLRAKHEQEWGAFHHRAETNVRRIEALADAEEDKARKRLQNRMRSWDNGERLEVARQRSLTQKQTMRQQVHRGRTELNTSWPNGRSGSSASFSLNDYVLSPGSMQNSNTAALNLSLQFPSSMSRSSSVPSGRRSQSSSFTALPDLVDSRSRPKGSNDMSSLPSSFSSSFRAFQHGSSSSPSSASPTYRGSQAVLMDQGSDGGNRDDSSRLSGGRSRNDAGGALYTGNQVSVF